MRICCRQTKLALADRLLQRDAETGRSFGYRGIEVGRDMLGAYRNWPHVHVVAIWRTGRGVAHPDLERRRTLGNRFLKIALALDENRDMVSEVLSHAGNICDH